MKDNWENFVGTANWVQHVGRGKYVASTGRACHAAIGYIGTVAVKGLLGTENSARRNFPKNWKNLSSPFLHWFLYESPYGEIILNRDDYEFCRDYGFIMSFDAPQPLFMNACIISRHFQECYEVSFQLFNDLVAGGIDPFLAYSCVFNSNLASYNSDNYKNAVFVPSSGHRVTMAYEYDACVNYYKGVWGDANKKTMAKNQTIRGASMLFKTKPKTESIMSWFKKSKEAMDAVDKSRGKKPQEMYKPPNPFKTPRYNPYNREKPTRGNFTFGELKVVLAVLQSQIEKEL